MQARPFGFEVSGGYLRNATSWRMATDLAKTSCVDERIRQLMVLPNKSSLWHQVLGWNSADHARCGMHLRAWPTARGRLPPKVLVQSLSYRRLFKYAVTQHHFCLSIFRASRLLVDRKPQQLGKQMMRWLQNTSCVSRHGQFSI